MTGARASAVAVPFAAFAAGCPRAEAPVAFMPATSVREVVATPEFSGFWRRLFPADDGYRSGDMIGNLRLAWYTGIRLESIVAVCKRLRADAAAGRTVFLGLYSGAEKRPVPDKPDTGLSFFRGKPGEPFAIVNAGGGFCFVGAMHDSFPHALAFRNAQRKEPTP